MITSIVIMTLSLAMFVYWFRYSCVLILESDWNEEMARELAVQNHLSFGESDQALERAESTLALDNVRDLLNRDLRSIRDLMTGSQSLTEAGASLESRMLMVDFQLMKMWYALTRNTSRPKAQHALRCMSRIVAYMAGELGDHMAAARG
ncbi:MAG: hypothetical protein FJW30_07820 [Acidobacteria bacterium]|nr:hypothetical protein [Acidobacteriota bacterium]